MAYMVKNYVTRLVEDERGDLVDVEHFCDFDCMEAHGRAPSRLADGDQDVRPASSLDEQDSDVYCLHCADFLQAGLETVRLVEVAIAETLTAMQEHVDEVQFHLRLLPAEPGDSGSGWSITSGDPQYLLDHRGWWGTATIPVTETRIAARAWEMIDEAAEAYNDRPRAEAEPEVEPEVEPSDAEPSDAGVA